MTGFLTRAEKKRLVGAETAGTATPIPTQVVSRDEFSGALSGGVILGTLTFTQTGSGGRSGTVAIAVTLR